MDTDQNGKVGRVTPGAPAWQTRKRMLANSGVHGVTRPTCVQEQRLIPWPIRVVQMVRAKFLEKCCNV